MMLHANYAMMVLVCVHALLEVVYTTCGQLTKKTVMQS